ncbi:MAG: hypothetical protein OXF08_11105 [Bacteroidetes bacterium]|nr:hypothetical protein [Bacteroidota bacterium]
MLTPPPLNSLKSVKYTYCKFIIIAFGFIILFAGCEFNDIVTDPVSSTSDETKSLVSNNLPSISDGRIVFEDQSRFQQFLESIVNKDDSYLDSIETGMNFVSLRSDTERLAEQLGKEIEELQIVTDKYFATALNSEGEYQIGDVVHRVTRSFIYSVNESNSDYLDSISLRDNNFQTVYHKTGHHPEVNIFEIQRFPDPDVAYKTGEALRGYNECSGSFFNRRRIVGKIWTTDNSSHFALESVLKSQRKGFLGGWYGSTIDWLLADGNYAFYKAYEVSFVDRPWLNYSRTEPLSSGRVFARGEDTKRIEQTHYSFRGDNSSNSNIYGNVSVTFSGQRTDKGTISRAKCNASLSKNN